MCIKINTSLLTFYYLNITLLLAQSSPGFLFHLSIQLHFFKLSVGILLYLYVGFLFYLSVQLQFLKSFVGLLFHLSVQLQFLELPVGFLLYPYVGFLIPPFS